MSRRAIALVSSAVQALHQVDGWPAPHAAAGVAAAERVLGAHGDVEREFELASVTKLFTAYAALVALEEGTIELDDPAGPPGATVRHLLAHASGLPFDGDATVGRPGTRRVYSNPGFEALASHVAGRAGMGFAEYLRGAVLEPLGISARLEGSAAGGLVGTLGDVLRLGRELLAPTLVAPETLDQATTVQFPGLDGVLPGFGRMEPNDWGLGFELRDAKRPHWTGAANSPATYGHFGGSGTFLWVDPERELALCVLTDREFGDWALAAWPALSDAVLAA
jgi:CubicO group peptidase (beta-lactamase class C family)